MADERFGTGNGLTDEVERKDEGSFAMPGDLEQDKTGIELIYSGGGTDSADAQTPEEGMEEHKEAPVTASGTPETTTGAGSRYYNYGEDRTTGAAGTGYSRRTGTGTYGRRSRSERPGKWIAVVLAVILVFVLGAGAGTYISGRTATAELAGATESAQTRGGSKAEAQQTQKEAQKKTQTDTEKAEETEQPSSGTASQKTISRVADADNSLEDTTVADVAEKVMPSIVSVYNKYTETGQFFGRTYSQEGQSAGSGIIIEETDGELLIVTNNHVVAGADSLSVQFIDQENCEAALKGTDSSSDLAVIAVSLDDLPAGTRDAIAIANLGDSDSLRIGEHAIAIGNALGYGQSLTVGYVSALNREITSEDGITGTFIQTDAAINPGNSGGALLNSKGQVIGINCNKIGGSTVEGMGFAIPISKAIPIIDELKLQESRTKVAEEDQGVLGIHGISVTSDIASAYGLQVGAYVEEIVEGSGAAESDLQTGDIITAINGQTVTGMQDLQKQLIYYAAGTEVTLTVQHPIEGGEYEEREIKVTLSSRDIYEDSQNYQNGQGGRQGTQNWGSEGEEDFGNFFGFPFGF